MAADGTDQYLGTLHDRLEKTASAISERLAPQPRALNGLRFGQETPPAAQFEENQIRQFADKHWGGRSENFREALERLQLYRPVLEPILRSEGLPAELAAVPLIESAVQPFALSPKDARGLWQLVPGTARRYGLTVRPMHDDRIDVMKATRVAAWYLRDLYAQFGDWPLALAAYNAGEQAVQRAIDRAGSRDFWQLSRRKLLPEETRNYVPAVLELARLLAGSPSALQPETGDNKLLYAPAAVSSP